MECKASPPGALAYRVRLYGCSVNGYSIQFECDWSVLLSSEWKTDAVNATLCLLHVARMMLVHFNGMGVTGELWSLLTHCIEKHEAVGQFHSDAESESY